MRLRYTSDMKSRVEPGTWVVAVSGGVDSVALLDMLARLQRSAPKKYRFVVAHFDHGIRTDSAEDRRHVQKLAQQYGLPFVYKEVSLGSGVSEADARAARYEFLDSVRRASAARGVITAHHRDDVLETAAHHMLRGTGRRGLTALSHNHVRQRPLLDTPKQQLVSYAQTRGLRWREDSTNQDVRYTRNYIRHRLLSRLSESELLQLNEIIEATRLLNDQIDEQIIHMLHIQPHTHQIERRWFAQLPHSIAREVIHAWLRERGVREVDRKTVERVVVTIKAGRQGQRYALDKNHILTLSKTVAELTILNPPKVQVKSV